MVNWAHRIFFVEQEKSSSELWGLGTKEVEFVGKGLGEKKQNWGSLLLVNGVF